MRPYPTYWRRFLATAIDLFIVAILTVGIRHLPPQPMSSDWLSALFVLCLLVYEPLLLWYACTPGQAIIRIRVRDSDTLQRPSFLQALARTVLKYYSAVLTMFFIRRRANHDVISGTIMVDAELVVCVHDEDG
jgi:uncharacterized RDD family membrane protein YckC